jgi:hypothetical protein
MTLNRSRHCERSEAIQLFAVLAGAGFGGDVRASGNDFQSYDLTAAGIALLRSQ